MKPKVGVSACLLGERVRYDGDHRRDRFVVEELGARFLWVPVCPEVEAGFGVPRETLQLEGEAAAPRMVTTATRVDRTGALIAWTRGRLAGLPGDLSGFIFKRGSPSCGPRGVKLLPAGGAGEPQPVAAGLFARAWIDAHPDLPAADEEMLADRDFAAEFIRRVESAHARERGRRP